MELGDVIAYAGASADLPTADGAGPLSPREREVVSLIAKGRSNREIGEELIISQRTVEAHVTSVLNKLGARTRAQVAVWAVARGLTEGSGI
jgi:DNA-binding NarL/FixJ family response regulator